MPKNLKILLRLRVAGEVVSIVEDDYSIHLEIHGKRARAPKLQAWMENYMEEEGIIQEVLAGNTNFAQQIQLIPGKKESQETGE